MILMVSGRCDIPAFYSEWFYNRIKEGLVDIRNPYYEHQISRVYVNEKQIDCIGFCTKDPIPMIARLDEIDPIPYFFHVSITPYHEDVEHLHHSKKEILQAVKHLSEKLGKDRVYIRYDPIIVSDRYNIDYHIKAFKSLCEQTSEYIDHIIISFVDIYKNTKKHSEELDLHELTNKEIYELAKQLGAIGKMYHMHIQTCAEDYDLSQYGIYQEACFNEDTLTKIIGHPIEFHKGKGVRENCNCLKTVDIGDYNCCEHYCKYCYANYDEEKIKCNVLRHDPTSSVLLGKISEEDHIKVREEKGPKQMKLL